MAEEEGKTEYIRRRLLEARSEEEVNAICDELEAEGHAPGSVRAVKSELKSKGALTFEPEKPKTLVGKQLPVEALIGDLYLPPIVDGTRRIFDAGVGYGMKSILIGVRIAQELSRMGIDQASPIIKMAQEMRQTEGQVAKETGMAMGAEIAGKLFDYMEQRLPQQKPDIATVQDPMKGLMARTMEMMMNRLTGMVFGGEVPPTPGLTDKRAEKGG